MINWPNSQFGEESWTYLLYSYSQFCVQIPNFYCHGNRGPSETCRIDTTTKGTGWKAKDLSFKANAKNYGLKVKAPGPAARPNVTGWSGNL